MKTLEKIFINLHVATYEQLMDSNVIIWDWSKCINCENETPHHIHGQNQTCEVCSNQKLT